MDIALVDFRHKIGQMVLGLGLRHDDQLSPGNGHFNLVSFTDRNLFCVSFGNADSQAISPPLKPRFHLVDTMALQLASVKLQSAAKQLYKSRRFGVYAV
jgi:hypothetical protein